MQQGGSGEVGEGGERKILGGASVVLLDVWHLFARGDDTQAGILGGEPFEQGFDASVLEFSRHGSGRMLERLEIVEDEEAAFFSDEGSEARAALPGGAERGIGIAKLAEGGGDESLG